MSQRTIYSCHQCGRELRKAKKNKDKATKEIKRQQSISAVLTVVGIFVLSFVVVLIRGL